MAAVSLGATPFAVQAAGAGRTAPPRSGSRHEVIAALPESGFVLDREEVITWLAQQDKHQPAPRDK